MPADSQAITALQRDRLTAVDQLEDVQTKIASHQASITALQATETDLQDKIADIDAAINAAESLP